MFGGKKGSKILKPPPVRNCVTLPIALAMPNKLVVIINSVKVPKN